MVGMVPALFTEEEKDGIVNEVRSVASNAGYGITKYSIIKSIKKLYYVELLLFKYYK